MPPNNAIITIFGLVVLIFLVKTIEIASQKRRPQHRSNSVEYQTKDQLTRVSQAEFSAQPLMNKGEYKTFSVIESYAKRVLPGHRVFAQVSLGEILRCPDRDAFSAINAKRCDILVINPSGLPMLAVEYQGGGHYQQNAPMRDAVKKEALRQAGVPTIEIEPSDDNKTIEVKVAVALKIARPETAL